MITTAIISLVSSFVGSFLCFVVFLHFHLEEHWSEHHRRIEAERRIRRQKKREANALVATEVAKLSNGSINDEQGV